jgi:hypothetical protein
MSNIRSQLVVELSRELLGPRKGREENIDSNPAGEYLAGVLEPKDSTRGDFACYGSADLIEEEAGKDTEEEEEEEDKRNVSLGLQLGLPKTMGISFLVQGDSPLISFCATWARYKRQGNKWQRIPKYFLKENVDAAKSADWVPKDDTIRLALRGNITSDGTHHVSLYMINETSLENSDWVGTEDLVFQPQLRIVGEKNTEFAPMRGEQLRDEEEASLSLLYRNRRAFARGHLCSAIWKEIDPERPWDQIDISLKGHHPFAWIDAETVTDEEQRKKFTHSDLRTEFIPCYSIEQRPLEEVVGAQKYDPEILADIWNYDHFAEFFEPLLREYKAWMNSQENLANALDPEYRQIGKKHLELCEISRRRIQEGLEILRTDEQARLSFCFMNKVMHLQSIWKPPHKKLVWRPFQIAFILQCIPSIVKEDHIDRMTCDLLWFPTGGGKTEAYLGLTVFALALRRRVRSNEPDAGAGTGVISRYTLRLLTIQQFRRALHAILACDFLRAKNWHPRNYPRRQANLWGGARFSIGLWVGGDVTPNRLLDREYYSRIINRQEISLGATGLLLPRETYKFHRVVVPSKGDPAQILNCPACNSILAITSTNIVPNRDHWLHWLVYSPSTPILDKSAIGTPFLSIKEVKIRPVRSDSFYVISMRLSASGQISREQFDRWWKDKVKPMLGGKTKEESAKASLLGYFIRRGGIQKIPIDFEIHCVNPECPLNNVEWFERLPGSSSPSEEAILKPFRYPGKAGLSWSIPISAYVVDDQVYSRCPSLLISTVDKFARLSFEPRAATIFGNVDRLDDCWGYFRECAPPDRGKLPLGNVQNVARFKPPGLIIQDELHLIEGPLGSMVGLYETAIDLLSTDCMNGKLKKPKYIASSATVRRARFQVSAVFDRKTAQFPPPGIFIEDNFFSKMSEPHQLDCSHPGRLYVGICVPGKGPHTPVIRIWSALLQKAYQLRTTRGSKDPEADQFWTLIGFFNALRELSTAVSLYRQDMVEWVEVISNRKKETPRSLSRLEMELSSRMGSSEIPGVLNELAKFPENNLDAVFATSMFGTGIDVDRLGLMVVHGQPKTTATYIQATGRVGRQMGGLVVTFLRATRPRDLDHYEFFAGYHRSLARYVEPITVHPFSPRARERALGPICVAVLRNAGNIFGTPVSPKWAIENDHDFATKTMADVGPTRMRTEKNSKEAKSVIDLIETRAQSQPAQIRPPTNACSGETDSGLDRWRSFASDKELVFYEQTVTRTPKYPVVLGDPQHKARNKRVVFDNAPQSLREVEATATFGSR